MEPVSRVGLRRAVAVDPNMLINIEHEDVALAHLEGLEVAAGAHLDAANRAGV